VRKLDYYKRFTYIPNEVYDHLKGLEDAAGGDIDLVILSGMTETGENEPALKPTVSEANDAYVATVTMQIMNKAKTKVLEWYNGTLEVKVICGSTGGTVAINDGEAGVAGAAVTADLSFVNGVCAFTVTLGGAWVKDDTVKVTVDNDDVGIMSYSVKKTNHFLVKVVDN